MIGQRLKQLIGQHFKDYRSLYTFITALFLMGIIFGAVVVNSLSYAVRNDLLQYMQNFFGELSNGKIADPHLLFKESLGTDFQNLSLIWILGLSVIGLPVLFILIFVKGMFLGFTVGFLVSQMGFKGFWVAMVSVFPQNLLIIPNDIFLTVVAVACSLKIIRHLLMKVRREPLMPQFIGYLVVLLISSGVLAIACAFEAYVSPQLIRMLAF
ncbi:MAG: stage II sporulation protein M [Sporolactobacillus sp.]